MFDGRRNNNNNDVELFDFLLRGKYVTISGPTQEKKEAFPDSSCR